jgi:rhodanese-related sulfurtransferase
MSKAALEQRYAALRDKQFSAVPERRVDELLHSSAQRPLLCDVRTTEEIAVSTLPGARSRADVEASLSALAPGSEVVCFCTIGLRSGLAAQALQRQHPHLRFSNLAGGVLSWSHDSGGRCFVEPASGKETRRVHVYSADWALQADGYEPVVFGRGHALAGIWGVLRDKARAAFGL